MQVMMKLVDPASGRVLARSRAWALPEIGRPEDLFKADGQAFKQLFAKTAGGLVAKNLRQMRLVSG